MRTSIEVRDNQKKDLMEDTNEIPKDAQEKFNETAPEEFITVISNIEDWVTSPWTDE